MTGRSQVLYPLSYDRTIFNNNLPIVNGHSRLIKSAFSPSKGWGMTANMDLNKNNIPRIIGFSKQLFIPLG